jgi:hypothetical protein
MGCFPIGIAFQKHMINPIRRLYLYAAAFVSLEVVLWGLIELVRAALPGGETGGGAASLARGLALILVGLPVLGLHWRWAQRSANQSLAERSTRSRAVFLYGLWLATLVPVVQNGLAILDRSLLNIFGLSGQLAMLGSSQNWGDNLIAIALNAIAAAYTFYILDKDWQQPLQGPVYAEVRRIYRYLWLVYGLVLTVSGVQQMLRSMLAAAGGSVQSAPEFLANGLALLILGFPVWVYTGQLIRQARYVPAEAQSILHPAFTYFFMLVGVGGGLAGGGVILTTGLRWAFGEPMAWRGFLEQIAQPCSVALPLVGVWLYYARQLPAREQVQPEAPDPSSLYRIYRYLLVLGGLGAAFGGLQIALSVIVALLIQGRSAWGDDLRGQLAGALAALLIGIPLWLLTWRRLVAEAAQPGEAGDLVRRSVVRKAYLFLNVFVGVMGVMFSTGLLLYQLLSALLGSPPAQAGLSDAQVFKTVLLFAAYLAYHGWVLRSDGRLAESSLARRHAAFPVLVLAPDTGDFADQLVSALQRQVPDLPVAVHPYSLGVPDDTLAAARAVILPAELAVRPAEGLRVWLQGFAGVHLVVPTPVKDWHWINASGMDLPGLAQQTARLVRGLAEGEQAPELKASASWMIVVYILAGLFVLELLLGLIAALASFFTG